MTRSCCKKTNGRKFHEIFTIICRAEPLGSLGRTGEQDVAGSIPGSPNILFSRIDDSHCGRIQFFSQGDPLFRQWLCGKAARGLFNSIQFNKLYLFHVSTTYSMVFTVQCTFDIEI